MPTHRLYGMTWEEVNDTDCGYAVAIMPPLDD